MGYRLMIFVNELIETEIQQLNKMLKKHSNHACRMRSQAILLSFDGFKLKDIAIACRSCRQTVSTWIRNWKEDGINSLLDKPRSGRPCKLLPEQKTQALKWIEQSPRSLKNVVEQLAQQFSVQLNCATLRRLCKQNKLSWKRIRKSTKLKRNPELFEKSRQELAALIELEKQNLIDLYYFDESGFTLEPCVPYAWQPIKQAIEVACSKSKRLNVLGFMNKKCDFQSMIFEGSITSSIVVHCIDMFASSLKNRPTYLVIDNASIHTSGEFNENLERWKELGLNIVRLAPYSPELNLIEILWRKIKYEWMPFSAYDSFKALNDNLYDILANIGKKYTINFS
jgi:transposase